MRDRRRGLAIGFVTAVFIALVVCGVAALLYARVATATSRPAETINPWTVHGVVRIGSKDLPDTLGPMLGEQYVDDDLVQLWGGFLLAWNDQDQYVPDLAVAVPSFDNGGISQDGLTFTYHLRKHVLWQDGAPFTARDVVFSWHAVMNPRNFIASRAGYELISRIDTPDPYTVVIHLRRRFAPFLGTFFAPSSEPVPVMPEHLLARYPDLNDIPYNALPIGTGPFRVVADQQMRFIRFVANPLYWRGRPGLNEIDFEWLPDDRALLDALREHRIDVYLEGAQALEPQLQGNRGYSVYLYPFTRFADLGFNMSKPQLQDRRVRQALAFATDRMRIIDEVTNGVNIPADSDQPPFGWAYSSAVPKYPYDPRRAGQLLDAAGWRLGPDGLRRQGGLTMRLELVGWTGSVTAAEAESEIAREWRAVGVDTVVHNYSSDALYADKSEGGIQQNGRFDVTYEEWGFGVDPDDSNIFECGATPPEGWNIYHYCDPALDAAEADALTRYDVAGRKAAYARIQAILAGDLPLLPLWYVQSQDVVNIDLRNYKPAHAFAPLWNSWEWKI
ncbi:MAG TPA: peptide ABC transporter substrate-binding protein [Candidatus Eremiobacteraceae bacterium]|nr:peptide ABC transporter substrate-binding protein [Candidatus Eremiobacteraceae bacterium]